MAVEPLPTIIVSVTEEPAGYHGLTDSQTRIYAVHLTFGGEMSTVRRFLETSEWKFRAYAWSASTAALADKIHLDLIQSTSRIRDSASRLADWLGSVADPKRLPTAAGAVVELPSVSDQVRLGVSDVLHGSIAWDAPMPQDLGLTYLVRFTLTEGEWPTPLLILPFDEPTLAGTADGRLLEFANQKVAGVDRVTLKTNTQPTVAPPLPLPSPVAANGFLESSFGPEEYRLLEALEAKGASLIWSLPAFLGFLSNELQRASDVNPMADWCTNAAETGCRLALDPLLLAVGKFDSDREGALLGSLATSLDSAISAAAPTEISQAVRANAVKIFVMALRKKAEEMFARSPNAKSLEDLGVPKGISDSLFSGPPSGRPKLVAVLDGLKALMAHFQSERGIETALKKLLQSLSEDVPGLPDDVSKDVKQAIADASDNYIRALDRGINAADAVRAEGGHRVVTEVIVRRSKNSPKESIERVLMTWDPYTERLSDPLAPCVKLDVVPDGYRDYLGAGRWQAVVQSLLIDSVDARRRFQPDSVPQPLPISISTAPGGDGLADFTGRFNGIGVILRSRTASAGPWGGWAHANLASFDVWRSSDAPYETPPDGSRIGIRAFLPVAVDGRREMFLRYNGFPLSSEAFRDTHHDDGVIADATKSRRPFYQPHDVNPGGFEKVPRLAYGRTYQWAAFGVTKGGSLPKLLQQDDEHPWLPGGAVGDPLLDKQFLGELPYLRRTAVGATTIGDSHGQPHRIGVRYPEVFPLSLDSPRLCLSAIDASEHLPKPALDLFRNSDGTGQLEYTAGDRWKLELDDLLLVCPDDNRVEVIVELIGYGFEGEISATTSLPLTPDAVSLVGDLAVPKAPPVPVPTGAGAADPGAAPRNLWLRLRLKSEVASASLAFNPPRLTRITAGGETLDGKNDPLPCHPDTPPVLLVGASSCWSPAFSKPASAQVVLPRTTWLDWEHWCGNRSLDMYGHERHDRDAYAIADDHLLTASMLRTLDDEINRLLDRLPDPSVSVVIAELSVVDEQVGNRGNAASRATPRPAGAVVIPYRDICDAFGAFSQLEAKSGLEYGEALRGVLTEIDKRFCVAVEVKANHPSAALPSIVWNQKTLIITVPEGTIARLTIRPFVTWPEAGHPAFDERIKQLAVGEARIGGSRGQIFEGAALTIEAMCDPSIDPSSPSAKQATQRMLEQCVAIEPIAKVRDYRVLFNPKGHRGDAPVRLFSHTEMRSQRWRFSGRPIYGWINPHDHKKAKDENASEVIRQVSVPTPAIELEGRDEIRAFEAELFFDRDDADCEFTRIRLTGGCDELLACPWELPAATYFRHAFNFVSRYAGAMQTGKGTPLWPRRQADWSHRVAMLADAPRLEVTRPQTRCIVPLTTSPDGAGPSSASPDIEKRSLAPTAPVACILEERPFAVGGLAERMLGEIVTGLGYGFDGREPRVHPLDFGKETSRDGRLSAWGWTPPAGVRDQPSPARSIVVETEGPVGLHFEEMTTSAPAWSNCQYILRPRSLRDGVALPEESFLGVQLRRFLDPDWIFEPNSLADKDSAASEPPTWLQTACIARHKLAVLTNGRGPLAQVSLGEPSRLSLIDYENRPGDKTLVIYAQRAFLGANYPEGSIALCELPLPQSDLHKGELALLHMPHGDGSFTMSIAFLPADDDATSGLSKAPLIVGTVRWTLAHLLSGTNAGGTQAALEFPAVGEKWPIIQRTAMSQPTYREWTRTAKNADFITLMKADGADQPIRISDICATLNGRRQLEFRLASGQEPSLEAAERRALWLCGSLANSRMPLFVHRYLVGVFTSSASQGRRSYQSFSQARLLVGRRPTLPIGEAAGGVDTLTLHEMEVPAAIVAGGIPRDASPELKNLKRFESAVVDLRATGGLPTDCGPNQVMAYRLHVRFANSKTAMSNTTATVRVDISKTAERADPSSPSSISIQVPRGVHSLDVVWTSENQKPWVRFILWDCLQKDPPTESEAKSAGRIPEEIPSDDVIAVTIGDVSDPTAELWADVSLLHQAVPKGTSATEAFDTFTFDWLFSSSGPREDLAPASRTLPATLAERREAQGRLVSSSAPIMIDRLNGQS